jgi:hypothetical protein
MTTPEVWEKFHFGRRHHVGNSSACYKMGNYHPILMKIDTQIKKNVLTSKVTKAEAHGKSQKKFNVNKRYRFQKATLYQREVIKYENCLFLGRSFHTHTTGG